MELPSKHVLHLSKKIGSRGPGSDGEAAAASYVLRVLDDLDIEVNMESVSCWKSGLYSIAIIYGFSIGAYFLFRYSYWLSLLCAAAAFLFFQMETYTWAVISRLLPRTKASNVMGRIRPSQSSRKRVVLVANYDTAKSSPLSRRPVSRAYRLMYVLSFACVTFIVLMAIVGIGASLTRVDRGTIDLVWLFFSPFPAYLFLFGTVLLWGEATGRYTPGANDNASGVGVMLSVMSSLAHNPLEHTDVWCVATARGAVGGRGTVALLRRHHRQLKDAYFINIDHAGVGRTLVFSREGVMLGFRCSRTLKKIAFEASSKSEDLDLGKGRCRVKNSDGMAARARGFKSISIGGLRGGSYWGWRNKNDVYEELDRQSLDRAVRLVQLMLEHIDAEQ